MQRSICFALLYIGIATASPAQQEVPLWPGEKFAEEDFGAERVEGQEPDRRLANVRVPSLTIYRPSGAEQPTAGVIICPGGGYGIEAIDKEGHEVARWFASRGAVGIVLKYRLPRGTQGDLVPLEDVDRAVRMTRHEAGEWGIDPARIGVMGFSAGGHLASTVATLFDDGHRSASDPVSQVSSRPNFQILIYPVISLDSSITHRGSRDRLLGSAPSPEQIERYSTDLQVSDKSPPAFLVSTSEDVVTCEHALRYATALKRHRVPVELHLYARGEHGYGMRPGPLPVHSWPERLEEWLLAHRLLPQASENSAP